MGDMGVKEELNFRLNNHTGLLAHANKKKLCTS